jgi:hypothetical protein
MEKTAQEPFRMYRDDLMLPLLETDNAVVLLTAAMLRNKARPMPPRRTNADTTHPFLISDRLCAARFHCAAHFMNQSGISKITSHREQWDPHGHQQMAVAEVLTQEVGVRRCVVDGARWPSAKWTPLGPGLRPPCPAAVEPICDGIAGYLQSPVDIAQGHTVGVQLQRL